MALLVFGYFKTKKNGGTMAEVMSQMMSANDSENILIEFDNIIKNNKLLYTFGEEVNHGMMLMQNTLRKFVVKQVLSEKKQICDCSQSKKNALHRSDNRD